MFPEILKAGLSWVVGALLGWALSQAWSFWRAQTYKKFSKFTYYRIIRLRFKDRGDAPYYIRTHHTLPGVSEPVYDETWCLNAMQCNRKVILEPVGLSSSGIVDAIQILPTLDRDADNHPHTRESAKKFLFSHPEPSTSLGAVGTMVNGIQSESEWWYGTTAQYNGQTLLLVVDFTSLPYEVCPIFAVTSRLTRDGKEVPKSGVEKEWFEDHVGEDLHYLKFTNARKGDVITFQFRINMEQIPIIKADATGPKPSAVKSGGGAQSRAGRRRSG